MNPATSSRMQTRCMYATDWTVFESVLAEVGSDARPTEVLTHRAWSQVLELAGAARTLLTR
jgi:hypothetical protein